MGKIPNEVRLSQFQINGRREQSDRYIEANGTKKGEETRKRDKHVEANYM